MQPMPDTSVLQGHSFTFRRIMGSALVNRDVCFAVVGATGWLGRATLDMLDSALRPHASERVIAFGQRGREIKLRAGRTVRIHAIDNLGNLVNNKRYVFLHYAFLTRGKVARYSHDDYIAAMR